MDALKDLKWLLVILVILWVVWFLLGGPARFESIYKPFVKPYNQPGGGELYGPK